MYNTNEHKSFDELFADSAGMQQFPIDKDAWLDMEARLDERDRRRRWTALLWLSIAGVLLLGGLWTLGANAWEDAPSFVEVSQEKIAQEMDVVEKAPARSEAIYAQTELVRGGIVDEITGTSKVPAALESSTTGHVYVEKSISTSKPSMSITEVRSQADAVNGSHASDMSSVSILGGGASDYTTLSVIDTHKKLPMWAEKSRESVAVEPIADITAPVASRHRTSYINPTTATQTIVTKGKYTLGLHLAPEWSSVGLLSDKTLAWRVGGDVAYSINPQWEVSLGVGYSKKLYQGQGEDYINADGWIDDVSPESMKAKCFVIDVPIMARRYFGDNRTSGFYAEIGVSNYILDTEWYGFEYKEEDKIMLFQRGVTPLDEITIEQSSNNHWVGVGQFSIGYRQQVKERYYIDIAPYVSVPFTGIGEGKVKLYSTGVRFSARFTQ